jgi:hypothetical protein
MPRQPSKTARNIDPSVSAAKPAAALACGVEVDAVSDREWDLAFAAFADAHYEQAACAKGGSHLLIRNNGVVLAGARVAVYALPGLGKGLALVRFGPFWRRREQPADMAVYRAAIGALVDEYCVRRGHSLVIRPRPDPDFYAAECEALAESGFVVRRPLPAPARYCADLSLDEDAMLGNFDQKWRYNLRKAQKHNFDIRLCDTEAEIVAFRKLHHDMTARKALDADARGMIDNLEALARLPDPIRMRVILVRHEGETIAGATVGVLGNIGVYVLGATNATALKLNAGYAMQWWIMRWLHSQNIRWYELGGTGDPGIRQFKKGLIGKRGVILETGEFDRWTSTTARLAADVIYGLRAARAASMRLWK